jgi:hypothetical protein
VTVSTVSCWISQSSKSGMWYKNNCIPEENKLIALCKKLDKLPMKNDSLRQAALLTLTKPKI